MRFSHNLTHGIWGKVNDCTLLYSTVQCSTEQYSTVRAYMPTLALLRVKGPSITLSDFLWSHELEQVGFSCQLSCYKY